MIDQFSLEPRSERVTEGGQPRQQNARYLSVANARTSDAPHR